MMMTTSWLYVSRAIQGYMQNAGTDGTEEDQIMQMMRPKINNIFQRGGVVLISADDLKGNGARVTRTKMPVQTGDLRN